MIYLKHLTDAKLIEYAEYTAKKDRDILVDVLRVLEELEFRNLSLDLAYASLFAFTTQR